MNRVVHIPPRLQTDGLATEETLQDLNSKHNTLGQKDSDDSMPVVLSSEQFQILLDGNISSYQIHSSLATLIDLQRETLKYLKKIYNPK